MGLCFGSEARHGPQPHISKPSTSSTSNHSRNVESSVTGSSVEHNQFSELASGSLDGSYWDHNGQILDRPNLKEFTFNDMRAATRNFKPDALLGEGGFGKVYRGWLDEKSLAPTKVGNGMMVAIKRLNPESLQGVQEWQSEVNLLGRFSHPNLVKLLGFCGEENDLLLVYEFMPKGSLENHLFRKNPKIDPLSWEMRLKITIGAARGLAFLHTSETKVIYRDFKTSNILLDGNYVPKISDFGLAKFGPPAGASHVTTRIIGTFGYAAPEYIATGHLYVQSDVYGFGVVLLEVMTGLRAIDTRRPIEQQNLVEWVKPQLSNRKKLKTIMDTRIAGQYSSKASFETGQLALKCLEADPRNRPSMEEVTETLEKIKAMDEKPKDSKINHGKSPALRAG